MNIDEVKQRVVEFCAAHDAPYLYCDGADPFFGIGQSGFHLSDIETVEDLSATLYECLNEHLVIRDVEWNPDVIFKQLRCIGDEPATAAIVDEIGKTFDADTLQKLARILYKHVKT